MLLTIDYYRRINMKLTDSAVIRLKELISEEQNPDLKLRVFVQGGGCAGFSYGFSFEKTCNDDDVNFNYNNITLLVDPMSLQYLQEATIDYQENLMGASFTIDNPNATTTCGCGSSFSPF